MKHKNQLGLLFGMLLSVASIQPAMAVSYTPVLESSTNVIIKSNTRNNSWSQVHYAGGCGNNARFCLGRSLLSPLKGNLNGVLETYSRTRMNRGYEVVLKDISGTLTSRYGSLKIHDGQIRDIVNPGYAKGFLDYTFTKGRHSSSGTFYFNHTRKSSNYLTDKKLQLWGNNWNPQGYTSGDVQGPRLGLDLRGDFRTVPTAPVPEPSTMLLLGSGLLALPFLRKKSQQA